MIKKKKTSCFLTMILLQFLLLFLRCSQASAATEIRDRAGLEAIADQPNGDYILVSDIAIGGKPWTPISFNGSFNGNGHTIWGLNLSGDYDRSEGIFLGGNCQVMNLNLTGINIDINILDWNSFRFFGNGSELSSANNCELTGSVKVKGNGCTFLFENASSITADLNLAIEGASYPFYVFRNCEDCHLSGKITIDPDNSEKVSVFLLQNCFDSTSDVELISNYNNKNSAIEVTGLDNCIDCNLSGTFSHTGSMTLARGCGFCDVDVTALSDTLTGLSGCNDSSLTGYFYSLGQKESVSFVANSEQVQDTNNKVSGVYTYQKGDAETKTITITEAMGNCSSDRIDYTVNATDENIIINMLGAGSYGQSPYGFSYGLIEVHSDAGNIDIYRKSYNSGKTFCYSNTGNIKVENGVYNSGDIYAETVSGETNITGATYRNTGNITVRHMNSGRAYVIGSWEYNYGEIDVSGFSVMATGADWYNTGNVIVNAVETAIAQGASRGELNLGNVTAVCTNGYAGASTEGYNSGNITATATNSHAKASAANGTVRATSYGSSPYDLWAEASAGAGSAYAYGQFAYATGAYAEATSTKFNQHVTTGYIAWYEYANPDNVLILSEDEGNPTQDYYNVYDGYYVAASARRSSDTAPEMPEMNDEEMPSEDIDEEDAWLDISLELKSSVSGCTIDSFVQTFGSFSWYDGTNDDFSSISMNVHIHNYENKDVRRRFKVSLPDGFSFQGHAVIPSKSFDVIIPAGETKTVTAAVYPLYCCNVNSVQFQLTGEIEYSCYLNVEQNPNAGMILMRPTSSVNYQDMNALTETISLDPVADFISLSVNTYSNRLALLGCAISQSVYNTNHNENSDSSYIYSSLRNLGFSRIKWFGSDSSHDVAAGFALKTIVNGGEVRDIIMIAIRGTVDNEWIGNFNVRGYDEAIHEDFNNCAMNVLNRLTQYMNQYNIQRGSTRAFICGHSRGGAVADLVAHYLNGNTYGSLVRDLTTYTFAAPNSMKNPTNDSNIFNYVYKYDFVPFVPHADFGKPGRTYVVGGENNYSAPDSVQHDFFLYTGGKLYRNVGSELVIQAILASDQIQSINHISTMAQRFWGNLVIKAGVHDDFVARAHSGENYLAWVRNNGISGSQTIEAYEQQERNRLATFLMENAIQTGTDAIREYVGPEASEVFDAIWEFFPQTYPNGATYIGVGCPVDIEVKNSAGLIVAKLERHQETLLDGDVLAIGDGQYSHILVPTGEEFTLSITGTDMGTMRIVYGYVDSNMQEMDAAIISDIPVSQGTMYTLSGISSAGNLPIVTDNLGNTYTGSQNQSGDLTFTPWTNTDEYVVHTVAFATNDTVFWDGWISNAEIDNYDELKEQYGTEPSWDVQLISGNLRAGTWRQQIVQPQRCEIMMDELPENETTVLFTITCTWGDQAITARKTVDFKKVDLPSGSDIPEIIDLQVGQESSYLFHFNPEDYPSYTPRIVWGFRSEKSFDDYVDVLHAGGDTGHELILKPKAGSEGLYPGYLWITSGNVAVGQRKMLFRISDENGYVPNPELAFEGHCNSTHQFYRFEQDLSNIIQKDGWVRNYTINYDDYTDFKLLYGDEPVWSAEVIQGNGEIRFSPWEDKRRFDVWVDKEPTTDSFTFRVTCSWGGQTITGDATVVYENLLSLPTDALIPESVDMVINQTSAIPLDFAPSGYCLNNDRRVNIWSYGNFNRDQWCDGYTQYITPHEAGIFLIHIGPWTANLTIMKDVIVRVADENGNVPGPDPVIDGYGQSYEFWYYLGELSDNLSDGWVTSSSLFSFYPDNFTTLRAFYGENASASWSATVIEGQNLNIHTETYEYDGFSAYGSEVVLEEMPPAAGYSIIRLTNNWNEHSGYVDITVRFFDKPATLPNDSTFPSIVNLRVGETVSLTGHYINGNETHETHAWMTSMSNDNISFYRDLEKDPYTLSITAVRAGTTTAMTRVGSEYHGFVQKRIIFSITDSDDFVLPSSLKNIEDEAFEGINAEIVIIPSGCTTIGSRAFAGCENLVEVVIPETVISIAADAFEGCADFVISTSSAAVQQYAEAHGIIWVVTGQ